MPFMPSEEIIRAYFLEELSETERAALDVRLFTEPELCELFAAAEDDLIDDYLRQRLTPVQEQRFAEHYLISQTRQTRVAATRVWHQSLGTDPPLTWRLRLHAWWARQNWGRPALVAVNALWLLVLGGALWWAGRSHRPTEIAQQTKPTPSATPELIATPRPSPVVTATPQGVPAPTLTPPRVSPRTTPRTAPTPTLTPPKVVATPSPAPPVSPPVLATLLLQPGRGRDDGQPAQQLNLVPATNQVRLSLALPLSDYQVYRAVLTSASGVEVFRQKFKSVRSQQLTLTLPAARLVNGDYVVRLYGQTAGQAEESISDYFFRVQRK